jgi:hypothetical protein
MTYWIFKINPDLYDIERRLQEPSPAIRLRVSSYRKQIEAGDVVFQWITGTPRGIRAVLKLDSDPFYVPYDPANPEWSDEYKVDGIYVLRFSLLDSTAIKEIPGLQGLAVFHGFQARTNFAVTSKEGQILMKLIYLQNPGLEKVLGLLENE